MYGLPPAGKIAKDRIQTHLVPYGYTPVQHTPRLCCHHTRPITFTLVVDDFSIKYTNLADFESLHNALKKQYETTTNMICTLYCGLALAWHYDKRYVDVTMPGYIAKTLH